MANFPALDEDDWDEFRDFIIDAISDSMDIDWTPSMAADLIVDRLKESPEENVEGVTLQ